MIPIVAAIPQIASGGGAGRAVAAAGPELPTAEEAAAVARPVTEIIVHCSATPAGRDVGAAQIRRWHLARGFRDIGYHFVIRLDGTVEPGRPLAMQGAHCPGHNAISVGVCYIGGCDSRMNPADTRTPAQREALERLIVRLLRLFPGATVHGHRDFAAKACPSFDATSEYEHLTR